MKKLLFALGVAALFGACSPVYYQVYQTKPVDEGSVTVSAEAVVYSDANCRVSYNFFREGGDAGFVLTNTSDQTLYLHTDECFYVLDGMAYDYFTQSFYWSGTSRTTSSSLNTTESRHKGSKKRNRRSESKTTINTQSTEMSAVNGAQERNVIAIPPHASKRVGSFAINEVFRPMCDVKETPGRKSHGLSFSRENSPIVFSNRICYTLGRSASPVQFSNEFYVSEILNVSEGSMVTTVQRLDACGRETRGSDNAITTLKMNTADRFYIRYKYDKKKKMCHAVR